MTSDPHDYIQRDAFCNGSGYEGATSGVALQFPNEIFLLLFKGSS